MRTRRKRAKISRAKLSCEQAEIYNERRNKAPADHACVLLTPRSTSSRYDCAPITLTRWQQDPQIEFPAPVYVGRMRFFILEQLLAWERARIFGRRPPAQSSELPE